MCCFIVLDDIRGKCVSIIQITEGLVMKLYKVVRGMKAIQWKKDIFMKYVSFLYVHSNR